MSTGLGRGLGSLIPKKINRTASVKNDVALSNTVDEKDKILHIKVKDLEVNPMQPRRQFIDSKIDELVESIRMYGVIQPLIVSKAGDGYELIAGERRLRAAKIAKMEKIPVIIRDVDKQEKLEVALIENIQRENLNPMDLAMAYRQLIDEFGLKQEEVAKRVGRSRPVITNALRLFSLPEEVRLALIEGKIVEGHALLIVGLDTEEKQMTLFRKILHNKLSVGRASRDVRRMGGTKEARIKINYADKDKEFILREFFGSKAEIRRRGVGGQIIIDFYSNSELDQMVDKIRKKG